MLALLKKERVIAFDVHNHSFRSFLGFICFVEVFKLKKKLSTVIFDVSLHFLDFYNKSRLRHRWFKIKG